MDTLSLSNRVKERHPVFYLPLALLDLCNVTSTEDENFRLFGVSVEIVEVVCRVTEWRHVTMKYVLELEDTTAKFLGVVYSRNEEKLPMSMRDYKHKETDYAYVLGRLIKFADQPMISVLKMRNVTDYQEVLAHRARRVHLLYTLSLHSKAQGNEYLQAQVLHVLQSAHDHKTGTPLQILAEKLRQPESTLKSELFTLIERGQVQVTQNRVRLCSRN